MSMYGQLWVEPSRVLPYARGTYASSIGAGANARPYTVQIAFIVEFSHDTLQRSVIGGGEMRGCE